MVSENIKELVEEIRNANKAYSAGIPYMSDEEYDVLWQKLYEIDPDNPLLYHTAQDYVALDGLVTHKRRVFGTQKAFNTADLGIFLTRFGNQTLIIEPKYDGCAAVITKTVDGYTITLEGNGICGRDITHLKPYIQVMGTLRDFQTVEIIIPWELWSEEYGKNPRNVVAGWLNRKYETPETIMHAVPHEGYHLKHLYDYDGDIDKLNDLLLQLYAEWKQIYPLDGLLIKVKDSETRLIAANNGVVNNWSIAWKPPITVKETVVLDVMWNVSRLGRVIPTVIYEPVEMCGTTNQKATGNNALWLKERNIKAGSRITVGKAGEIIPKIIKVENSADILPYANKPIERCPVCKEFLQWDGVHLVCEGDDCIAKKVTSINYFYSNKGMMVHGLGNAQIEKLLEHTKGYEVLFDKPWALLDHITYELTDVMIDVLGIATASTIMENIIALSGKKNAAHFITALGLPKIGYKTAVKLGQFLQTGILNEAIPHEAIINFPVGLELYHIAEKEMENFVIKPWPKVAKYKYCITGTLSQSRDDMIQFLEEYGWEFSNGVTKNIDYLIVGENEGKIKITKAKKFSVPCISETQLINLLKED